MKYNIDKQLLLDINHLISWYQGRDVDRCDNVERWVGEMREKIENDEDVEYYKNKVFNALGVNNETWRLSGLKNYSQWGWMMNYCKLNDLAPSNSIMWERAREAYNNNTRNK